MRYGAGTTALAITTAGVLALAGCGSTSSGGAKSGPTAGQVETLEPETRGPGDFPSYQSPIADTPEEKLDALAEEKGWEFDGFYGTASEYVTDMCESFPDEEDTNAESSPAQWLAEDQQPSEDEAAALRAGVPKLCPERKKTVQQALSGHYERWFSEGTYDVGSGEGEIPPGTYRTKGTIRDCYWERTSKGGNIIDNNFATAASVITVTVAASDGSFTTRECGTWKPVK